VQRAERGAASEHVTQIQHAKPWAGAYTDHIEKAACEGTTLKNKEKVRKLQENSSNRNTNETTQTTNQTNEQTNKHTNKQRNEQTS
jgi:hypothetical protein